MYSGGGISTAHSGTGTHSGGAQHYLYKIVLPRETAFYADICYSFRFASCKRMSVIAIVGGTGPEGTGLASRWARAGESIILGSRQADRARSVAERLRQTLGSGAAIEGDENSAAVARAEIVVLTIPFSAHAETLKSLKSAFRPAAVLIDTTVPLASSVGGRATQLLGVWQGSAAQQAAELAPKGVVVAAAFQNLSA